MKKIYLPAGTEHVQFGELAQLIANALRPLDDDATDSEMMAHGGTRINLEAELNQAVKDGTLPVKDPLTFGPHTFPVGDALRRSLVTVGDLRAFLAGRPVALEIAPEQAETPEAAPVVAESHGLTVAEILRLAETPSILDAYKPLPDYFERTRVHEVMEQYQAANERMESPEMQAWMKAGIADYERGFNEEQGRIAARAAAQPPQPAPQAAKRRTRTMSDAVLPYMRRVFEAGQFATAKELYKALEGKAGQSDSPFERGSGDHRGSLFVREFSKPLALKTVQNSYWPKLNEPD